MTYINDIVVTVGIVLVDQEASSTRWYLHVELRPKHLRSKGFTYNECELQAEINVLNKINYN